jgi:hypothetical protein
VRITIDVPDMYVDRLRTWASVSRTLNQSKTLVQEFGDLALDSKEIIELLVPILRLVVLRPEDRTRLDGITANLGKIDEVAIRDMMTQNIEELSDIEPMLNALHQAVRSAIWEDDSKKLDKK